MNTITEIDIKLDIRDVLKAQSRQINVSPKLMEETQKSISRALLLVEPLIAYRFVMIHKVADGKLFLESYNKRGFHELNMGPYVTFLNEAKMAMISVHTIGPDLDARVKALNDAGKHLESYVLNCAGLVALNEVGKHRQKIVEEKAKKKGWGVSASLSPGSLKGWELTDQKNVCSILDIEKAGITLSDSFVLIPFKTVSSLIGMGPGYTSKKVGSICKFCNHKNTCWKMRISKK